MTALERLREALLDNAGKLEITLPVELLEGVDREADEYVCDCEDMGVCYCGCKQCAGCHHEPDFH